MLKLATKIALLYLFLYSAVGFAADSTNISPQAFIPRSPYYYYTFLTNTTGWYCDNCYGYWNAPMHPVAGTSVNGTLPPGNYVVNFYIYAESMNGNGRWIKIVRFGIGSMGQGYPPPAYPAYNVPPTINILSSGYQAFGANGWYPYNIVFQFSGTYTVPPGMAYAPYFYVQVLDSSHNEAWWQYSGSAVFIRV